MWNLRHPDNKIISTDSTTIWQELRNKFAHICNTETCWVKQTINDRKLEIELLDAFAPESPKNWIKNPNEWLSSADISNVMKQFEQKYKCFCFLGPSPIDYDTKINNNTCVWNELCRFNLINHIKKGHFKIGIIFNLYPHFKNGSHWVSLFINIKKKQIFYFDSAGNAIPKQIYKLVKTIIKQGENMQPSIDFNFDQNYPVEHQYGNTECGMYSIFFIIHMLEDKITSHYLKTHIIKDKYIEQYRKIYFNQYGSF